MRLLLVFFIVFIWTSNAHATAVQKPVAKPAVVKKGIILKSDSSKVDLRKFDETAVKKYSVQKDFIYDDVAPQSLSLWDRFWRWIWRLINNIFSGGITGSIIKYVLIAVVIAIVVFAVIKLIGLDYKFLTGKSKAVAIPFEESLENIHEIDFDEQIDFALQNGNYRLAVRLLYLKTLKHLSDKQLINWQPEKTNQAYVLELENENYKQEFNTLTNQFEYIWYGEFFIDKSSFEPINQSFLQFNQKTI
ncbi:hypothetical protein GM921_13865 [Pedobacter sp. LMG 31464]|uniref:DUF4129 domain-containing protein n=1 Tax=Pedobacter planticolens TaxID=2679964 RepID=A0A923DYU6_9SPHI|nr:hypothetical protein [Pedobacter planticolens]MBB2146584.1 hypothetical protein [Pedobacter planticolens]